MGDWATLVLAICLAGMVQYVSNSGLVAIGSALKDGVPIWETWTKHYLWTSITYFTGASAAMIAAKLVFSFGLFALLATAPIITIVYFTYRTYLEKVESAAAQAEQARRHVAELSRYIAEQEKLRQQCAQLEKLSALGELASGVAHDFNNVLSGVLGRAQLLLQTDDLEEIKHGLGIIIKTAQDGAKTVKRIQDFARQRRSHDQKPVRVDQILVDVREITRPRWKNHAEAQGAHVRFQVKAASDAVVLGDEAELREVLVNMVLNALDAMPRGGRITLSSAVEGGEVLVRVEDTGIGIAPEAVSRIFDPFFTTKGQKGLGLGLAVSYGIIKRHGGQIEVSSTVGSGTTFTIRLPAAPEQRSVCSQENAPITRRSDRRACILVVDDEDYVRELLTDILTGEGHEVVAAATAREALQLLRNRHFDAVFSDVGMPEMNGLELAQAIRAEDERISLALITGWGEAIDEQERRARRIDWIIAKPFDLAEIIELAERVLERQAEVCTDLWPTAA